jgi:hypothetical protein
MYNFLFLKISGDFFLGKLSWRTGRSVDCHVAAVSFCYKQYTQAGPGSNLTLCLMGPGDKTAGAWSWPLTYILWRGSECPCRYFHPFVRFKAQHRQSVSCFCLELKLKQFVIFHICGQSSFVYGGPQILFCRVPQTDINRLSHGPTCSVQRVERRYPHFGTGKTFSSSQKPSVQALGPIQPPIQWVP